jgi:hypothetical protein
VRTPGSSSTIRIVGFTVSFVVRRSAFGVLDSAFGVRTTNERRRCPDDERRTTARSTR